MKLINTVVFSLIIILNMGFSQAKAQDNVEQLALLNTAVKVEVDETRFLPYNAGGIIDGFLQNGFEISNKNSAKDPFLMLNQKDSSDIGIRIYAKSQMSPVNGIFILVNLNENTMNTGSDKNKRPLNDETFNSLKAALPNLGCQHNADFLRSGFICNNEYEVLYSVNTDNFDGLRKFFGIGKRAELLISIVPVNR
ncbi:MAG: hypothetical protein LBH40_04110 [Alphaproteobacteria bacterium]|jgi:hypothetical protein|nr:hypothetical protein [Alphaproteobacteria bacterium]